MKKNENKIIGVVLCGGKSSRMGEEKCLINYNGVPQWQYMVNLMKNQGIEVYISCRKEQKHHFKNVACILDTHPSIGPMGGILSTMESINDHALLIIACDYPLIKQEDIEWLLKNRKYGQDCTLMGINKEKYEPTFAIYEASSFKHFKLSYDLGQYSLKKAIQHMNFELLLPLEKYTLRQANNTSERDELRIIIRSEFS